MKVNSNIQSLLEKVDNLSDYLLPAAVNESRQLVNSRLFQAALLIGFLLSLLFAVIVYVLPSNIGRGVYIGQVGYIMFSCIMDVGLILVIPNMIFANTTAEKSNGSAELLSITSTSVIKILLGKWQSGLLQSFTIGSLVVPCIVYSYLFNGLDLLVVLVGLVATLFSSQLAILMAIFFSSLVNSKIAQKFFLLANIASLLGLTWYSIAFKVALLFESNFLEKVLLSKHLYAVLIALPIIATAEMFIFFVSVYRMSSYSTNKSTILRVIYLIFVCEIAFVIFYFMPPVSGFFELSILIFATHFLASFFFITEKEFLPRRVYTEWSAPTNIFMRIYKDFFYPGKSSAYLLAFVEVIILYIGLILHIAANPFTYGSFSFDLHIFEVSSAVVFCLLFYFSCIYLALTLLHKIQPYAKLMVSIGFSLFIIILLFAAPLMIGLLLDDIGGIWPHVLNILYKDTFTDQRYSELYWPRAVISVGLVIVSCLVALWNNPRKLESYRSHDSGERGVL